MSSRKIYGDILATFFILIPVNDENLKNNAIEDIFHS